jgi:serralysin
MPAGIYASLESTAIDMGNPGFDYDSGFGLIQADAAMVVSEVFVRQQYLDFLDREPDSGSFAAWVNALDSGFPRASLIEAFMDSGEFRFKGKFIAQVYLGILARDAEHSGFRAWLGALLAGVLREQIVQGFLDSGEFQTKFGSNLTDGQFVERMYNNILLRPSDPGGFNYWVGQLNSGQMTRVQVALEFLDSAEFQNLAVSQNRVDVSLLYFDMLRRDPDGGGFSAWVGAMNAGVPLTSVIEGFLNSIEYKTRFAALVASL